MMKLLYATSSLLTGAILAFAISISSPGMAMGGGTCTSECYDICGDPGNTACTGMTCESGSTTCTKDGGEPGIPILQ